jgi:hypothetical protein
MICKSGKIIMHVCCRIEKDFVRVVCSQNSPIKVKTNSLRRWNLNLSLTGVPIPALDPIVPLENRRAVLSTDAVESDDRISRLAQGVPHRTQQEVGLRLVRPDGRNTGLCSECWNNEVACCNQTNMISFFNREILYWENVPWLKNPSIRHLGEQSNPLWRLAYQFQYPWIPKPDGKQHPWFKIPATKKIERKYKPDQSVEIRQSINNKNAYPLMENPFAAVDAAICYTFAHTTRDRIYLEMQNHWKLRENGSGQTWWF